MKEKIRIGLIDDEHLFLSGLKMILEKEEDLEVSLTASDGTDLLSQLASLTEFPDLLLIDLRMKPMDGLETVKQLRVDYPGMKVILLSTYYKDAFLGYVVKLGVSGFLPKNIDPALLARVIRKVHEKGLYLTDEQVNALQQQMMGGQKFKSPSMQPQVTLTAREREVLQMLCDQYTSQEIADQLFISLRTVEGHRNNLLLKIGAKNTVGLVMYAILHQLIDVKEKLMEYRLEN